MCCTALAEGITGLLLIGMTMTPPFRHPVKVPRPSHGWPMFHGFRRLDGNYGSSLSGRILSLFILTIISFLEYLLLLIFSPIWTPL